MRSEFTAQYIRLVVSLRASQFLYIHKKLNMEYVYL